MSKKNIIFLIGFMGSGKSTIASSMQSRYGWKRMEMDHMIEEQQGKSISRIFEENGEEYFRSLETELLKSFRDKKNIIVSCGGGTAMREENVREMRSQGLIVWLTVEPATVLKRIQNTHNRPLLEGNMNEDYIRNMMDRRMAAYQAAADLCVKTDGRGAMEIGMEIMKALRS